MLKIFLTFILCFVYSLQSFAQKAPVSVSVITGSYTVPVGKFARVTVEADSGGVFTINAVNALTTAAFQNVYQYTGSASLTHTTPTNYYSIVTYSNPNSGTLTLGANNVPLSIGNAINQMIWMGPGQQGFVTGSGASKISGVSIPSNATHRQAVFNVTAGTVLNGSGSWRAVVELYER